MPAGPGMLPQTEQQQNVLVRNASERLTRDISKKLRSGDIKISGHTVIFKETVGKREVQKEKKIEDFSKYIVEREGHELVDFYRQDPTTGEIPAASLEKITRVESAVRSLLESQRVTTSALSEDTHKHKV